MIRLMKFPLLFLSIFIFSCSTAPELIRDLQTLPQENVHYLNPEFSNIPMISETYQRKLDQRFDSLYFLPWHSTKESASVETIRQPFDEYKKNPGWGENLRKRTEAWVQNLENNAALDQFPNEGWPAITIANTDLRALPIHKPIFKDIKLAGEGYPFDYLQISGIAANTPIRVLHATHDRSWFWVNSHIAFGWLPSRDVAAVDSVFMGMFENGNYAAVTKDETAVFSSSGLYLYHASLGSIFPISGRDSLNYKIIAAVPDPIRQAIPVEAAVSINAAVHKPEPLGSMLIASLADELVGEPYGWGGMYMNRDCSATIKDLFAPFGLMLPRHSAHQARAGFDCTDLAGLGSAEKEKMIVQQGIPFMTLLWLKGHIMLYIGHVQGRVLVFHNLWGIRTRNWLGREGRKIIGQAVVTSLRPGDLLRNADHRGELLDRVLAMTYLVPLDSIRISAGGFVK